jgi:hypothetical protein
MNVVTSGIAYDTSELESRSSRTCLRFGSPNKKKDLLDYVAVSKRLIHYWPGLYVEKKKTISWLSIPEIAV